NCRIGFPIKELLRQNCVFHLDIREVPPDLAAFFMKVLLVFVEAEMMDTSEGELHLEIVLDELHLVDSREMENRNDLGEAMLRQSFRSLRHCGVGILGGDQLAALVPNTLIGLMNTKIAFLTPDGPSQLTLASSMTLDNEQRDFLGKLDRDKRQAVMHSSEFGGGAFLVQMPQMKLQKASLEEVAAAKKLAAERFPWTPIEPTITERPVDLRKALGGKHHEVRDVERSDVMTGASPEIEKQTKSEEQFLAVELLDYLRAVARDLLVTKTTRYKQLHLSAGKGDRLSDALVERGLIEEIKVPTGKRGGQPILLDITKAGRDLLARHHIKVNVPRGKGGLKHAFFQNAVQKWFAANFPNGTANIEDTDNDAHKAVDVAFVGDSKKIAVEILVNGVEKELSNIEADLEFEEIWMVAESRDQLARLQQKVQSSFPHHISRIQFHLITRFIAEMKSNGR
ncbi:MAG: ATP-binding protein, partial [Dehalococcoidia bacterium]|nr:ATP-binding protein [Dehalococcoidia bacterium]